MAKYWFLLLVSGCGVFSDGRPSLIQNPDFLTAEARVHQALNAYHRLCEPPVVPEIGAACAELLEAVRGAEALLGLLEMGAGE
jgi:hypothetical protein